MQVQQHEPHLSLLAKAMATYTFRKADPDDPRDIGAQIEAANTILGVAFVCRVEIVDWSRDDEPFAWVRVELTCEADIEAAGNWLFGELSRRGIVVAKAHTANYDGHADARRAVYGCPA